MYESFSHADIVLSALALLEVNWQQKEDRIYDLIAFLGRYARVDAHRAWHTDSMWLRRLAEATARLMKSEGPGQQMTER